MGREDAMRVGAMSIIGVQALNGNLDLTPAPQQQQQQPAAAPAPATQPAPLQEAPAPQQAKQPAAPASTGNPMDFFTKKKAEDAKKDEAKKDDVKQEDDEEEKEGEGKSSGSGSKGIAPKKDDTQTVPKERYDAAEAVEQRAKTGMNMMPEGLSDEVKGILKSAADTLAAGLFGTPELRAGVQSGGDSRTIKPANAQPGGGMKR